MTADVDDPSVYLLVLSRATANAAISDRLTQDCWTVVDYEIEASAGRMLFATRTQNPPAIQLDPPVEGNRNHGDEPEVDEIVVGIPPHVVAI